jgi:hypothetical protein
MNEKRMVDGASTALPGFTRNRTAWRRIELRVALSLAAIVPFGMACGGSSNPPPAAPNASANVAMGQPPPGYPGYPQAQPGYPQQQPGSYPPAQTGYPPQAGYPQQQGYPPQGQPQQAPPGPQPAPTASQPPGPLAPTDPNSLQGILQGLQGALQGTMVAPGSIPGDLTEAGLKAQALRLAPGMQPDGTELKQAMTEGQHAVVMVTLQAGKCYTILGFSPLGGVKDLDLNLLAPPLYMTLAGQDLTHNNTPVIGAPPSPMCPVIAFPLQYKLDVLARVGSGQVAVQLYSKNK